MTMVAIEVKTCAEVDCISPKTLERLHGIKNSFSADFLKNVIVDERCKFVALEVQGGILVILTGVDDVNYDLYERLKAKGIGSFFGAGYIDLVDPEQLQGIEPEAHFSSNSCLQNIGHDEPVVISSGEESEFLSEVLRLTVEKIRRIDELLMITDAVDEGDELITP